MYSLIRFVLFFSLISFSTSVFALAPETPPYAKWGRMAVQETQKRYPMAAIIDYLHVGRENLQTDRARETFRLWLRQDSREFGVTVIITFDPRTEKVISIQFKEGEAP
ncbi:MAG TPA: YqzG/YhdC family protein [Brevibacillus sp.]|nr:YqzG/YhdC family protein [Brevibacillus sp.]